MPWTNWGEQINREEMLCFVKQIRNRCDAIIKFVPSDELEIIYTLLEDIYEDAQAVATGYSAMTEEDVEQCADPTCMCKQGYKPMSGVIVQSYKRPDMVIEDEMKFGGWWLCQNCGKTHSNDSHKCPSSDFSDTDCTGDE